MIRALAILLVFTVAGALHADEKEGGIIGTGVIGQITGLDEFEVSGMRFGFAPDIQLEGVDTLEDLRMGMTLVLSTGRDGTAWQIKTLQHMPLLTGPVTAPGEVMGVPVAGALPTEGIVQVDGFWSDAGIVASRISPVAQGVAQVTGIYDGRGFVGLVPVRGGDLSGVASGQTLTVSGRFETDAIIVEDANQGPFAGQPPDLILLEGVFLPMASSDSLSLQGVAVTSTAAEQDGGRGDLVRRCALKGRTDFQRSELNSVEEELVSSFCVSASN